MLNMYANIQMTVPEVLNMKQFLRVLLCCLLLAAMLPACLAEGSLRSYTKADGYVYLNLGEYPQEADGTVKPILWRVLTVDDQKAYLCSEYILFAMPMHVNYTEYKTIGADFGQTELCAYLNGAFTQDAFKQGETELMLPLETYGKVFLLDSEDLKSKDIGMGVGAGLKAWGTEYAKANGLYVFQRKYGRHSPYWTRNQSTTDKRHARCTKDGGQLGHIISNRENEGVRPAIYLDLAKVSILYGAGTMEDPFILALPGAAEVPVEEAPALPAEAPAEESCCVPGQCTCCASCACGCQEP